MMPFNNPCPHVYRCVGYPKKCPGCKFSTQNDFFELAEELEEEVEEEEVEEGK